jgi:hypothetical protein
MAPGVVEVLEVVDVGHHQRERLAALGGIRNRLRQTFVEMFAVGQRCERVGQAFGADNLEVSPEAD